MKLKSLSGQLKVDCRIAKTAGMCYGVRRAVEIAEQVAQAGGGYTLGELIHNDTVKRELEARGVFSIDERELLQTKNDFSRSETGGLPVIIRSHGVSRGVYELLNEKGIRYIDATCPDVKKLHKIISEQTALGKNVIIMGDIEHPEITAVLGHALGDSVVKVVKSAVLLEDLLKREKIFRQNALILMAQTTFDVAQWRYCKEIIKKYCTNGEKFDTICRATVNRQQEARKLAAECNLMIVVGSSRSSNSRKLAQICADITPTFFVEDKSQLSLEQICMLLSPQKDILIGITAGASTPARIIKEVHNFMNEELKNKVVESTESGSDIDFMAEVDRTFKRVYIGNRVKACVVAVNRTEAVVDVGTKHSGYIPADELSAEPGLEPEEVVKVGDEIECIVTSINDAEGVVYLSKKRIDAVLGLETIEKALESGETLSAPVTAVVKGGLILIYKGARIFVPASQSGVPRTGKLEELQKQIVKFKVIEVNKERNRVVGSIRATLREELDAKREAFWNQIEVGQRYTGEVKSMESYGVFVDLGGVDGMVHLTELTWNRIKHPKEVVSVGEKLDVYVKNFDPIKRRVSLGVKDPNDNPWTKFLNDFNIGDVITANVVSITPFGAFARIIPGVDGLIHISQISVERVTNVAKELQIGQDVECKITEINEEKCRVSLSVKALSVKEIPQETTDDDSNEQPESQPDALVYSDDDVAAEEVATEEPAAEEVVTDEPVAENK
ncbi:MAG: 4-hydroxy-3-methylbut-2-enyl diphosphate reductase [Oscillospiraceae bacterium]|nr:4-hydroxy-3-methylbut-2-enyl diphosphate reductase [Oscillospiraceae bacterium]